eukprot:10046916-Karenia_brevis.AAC.1
MLHILHGCLRDRRLQIDWAKKSMWTCNSVCLQRFGAHTVNVDGLTVPYLAPAVGFVSLGSVFTANGGTTVDTEARVAAAWRCFRARRDLFCAWHVSTVLRVQLLSRLVLPSLLWGGQAWALRSSDAHLVRRTQQQMIHRMIRLPKVHGESWERYYLRRRAVVKSLL